MARVVLLSTTGGDYEEKTIAYQVARRRPHRHHPLRGVRDLAGGSRRPFFHAAPEPARAAEERVDQEGPGGHHRPRIRRARRGLSVFGVIRERGDTDHLVSDRHHGSELSGYF